MGSLQAQGNKRSFKIICIIKSIVQPYKLTSINELIKLTYLSAVNQQSPMSPNQFIDQIT